MVYSFLNVSAQMVGPGIAANLAAGAAVAEEGITIEPVTDKNEMVIGADGKGQHSLIANDAALITIRLLKTSPVNQQLMNAYDLQSASSALWGLNQLTITDSARGDLSILINGAFKKKPTITYAQNAGLMEWTFDFTSANSVLGSGQ